MWVPILSLGLFLTMTQPPDTSPTPSMVWRLDDQTFQLQTDLASLLGRMQTPPLQQPEPDKEENIPGSRRLGYLVVEATRLSGINIYVDSTLEAKRVFPLPPEIGNTEIAVERWLEALMPSLPEGASWVKLWLPPPPKGQKWTGDDVARFALALASLYGSVGSVQNGKSEILSRQIAEEQARDIKEKVGLQPVYLLTLRGSHAFTGHWNTTFGEMYLQTHGKRVTGTYTSNDGTITGQIRNGVLYFDWFERVTQGKGKGFFVLKDDGTSFSGKWGSNEQEPTSQWVGSRIP